MNKLNAVELNADSQNVGTTATVLFHKQRGCITGEQNIQCHGKETQHGKAIYA